ncbi:hypothetical protein [Aquimarina sp. SS2-1]|uniref:hypothetical protein n=1 Tax=Aquimarina besae TaxID=3342247 RepID=UPI0036711C82
MNKKLHNDWKQENGIFNNPVLYCEVEYSFDNQLNILDVIWRFMDTKLEENEELYFLEDWHNHDGHITTEKKITKRELEQMLHKPEKVLRNRELDVYDLVYNAKESFMLRWYCELELEDEIYCDFSLTLSDKNELVKLKEIMQEKYPNQCLKISSTKEYVDERYGG